MQEVLIPATRRLITNQSFNSIIPKFQLYFTKKFYMKNFNIKSKDYTCFQV